MIKKSRSGYYLSVILALALTTDVCAQFSTSPAPFYSYYYDYKLANPAFTGTKSKHVINTTYAGIPSGSQYAPRLFYSSYERNIASAKSGVGGLALFDKTGPVTLGRYGLFYSKQLPFNERSGLYLGTQVFYQSRKFDYTYYEYIDNSDPLITDGVETTRRANLDLGLLYYSSLATIGVSVKDIMEQRGETERTSMNVIVTREFIITDGFKANPSIFFFTDFKDKGYHLNSTFEIKEWILLGTGYKFTEHGSDNLSFNVGLNIKDWVQIITHMYSSVLRSSNADAWVETMIRVKIPERHQGESK